MLSFCSAQLSASGKKCVGRGFLRREDSNTTYVAQMVVFAAVIADACMLSDVIDCDVHNTPLNLDDKGAPALRGGGSGDYRGRAHAPAYERSRGSM